MQKLFYDLNLNLLFRGKTWIVEFKNLIPGEIVLLEGNLCNFEGKFIIYLDGYFCLFLHKNL